MPSGGIWPGVFLHQEKKILMKIWKYENMKYENILMKIHFLKMFFLISGLILMSYITDVLQNNKF